MEIGLANEKDGISFFKVFYGVIGTKDKTISKEAEISFISWFLENFHNPDYFEFGMTNTLKEYRSWLYTDVENCKYHEIDNLSKKLNNFLDGRWFLNGQASKQYLDYLELKESREAAVDARKKSNISIAIAILALLVSTGFGIYQNITAPKPPFEVRVIEDSTKTDELEQEVKELKVKLSRADLLINIYESDD